MRALRDPAIKVEASRKCSVDRYPLTSISETKKIWTSSKPSPGARLCFATYLQGSHGWQCRTPHCTAFRQHSLSWSRPSHILTGIRNGCYGTTTKLSTLTPLGRCSEVEKNDSVLILLEKSTVLILLRPALLPLYLKIPQSFNAFMDTLRWRDKRRMSNKRLREYQVIEVIEALCRQ